MVKGSVLTTITDLPWRGCLFGEAMKGYKGCLECLDHTDATWLSNSHKMVYMGHHRFLPGYHPYRRKKSSFDGNTYTRSPLDIDMGRGYSKRLSN